MITKFLSNVFKFQNTYLWRAIVELKSKKIAAEICM